MGAELICGRCGYDLTGCPTARCPECGTIPSWSTSGWSPPWHRTVRQVYIAGALLLIGARVCLGISIRLIQWGLPATVRPRADVLGLMYDAVAPFLVLNVAAGWFVLMVTWNGEPSRWGKATAGVMAASFLVLLV